jgi:hypothetical protein
MPSAIIAVIRTTLVALRLQAASATRCMNGDLVVIIKAEELDGILKKIIGWIDQLGGNNVDIIAEDGNGAKIT